MSQHRLRSRPAWKQWLQSTGGKLWRRWLRANWRLKALLVLILLLLGGRSLPYLTPIRAVDLRQNQQAMEFTDRNGLPLGTILTRDQNHTIAVPLAQISPHFIQAIIAAEDQRFYQHGALDGQAIARALLEAMQSRHLVSGASTITMQLARMLDRSPRTLNGKLREIWTAWRLSAGMTKDEILQAYINRLPMGGNIYGVEAASRSYFGVSASDLNLAQASLLAAIPNDPNRLNPYDRWDALKQRQSYVLDRMVALRQISPVDRDRTDGEHVSLQLRSQGIQAAPHFLFWLADQYPSPARLQTTLDRPLQQFVEAQVQQVIRQLAPHNVHHAAVLVVENHSGEVLAYVGSPDYFAEAQLGRNDGVQALRQPGSTLKPFLYQLALEKRLIRPNTVLADVPTHYAIPGARLYSPLDYSETFQGPVRIRFALANSLNVPAVRILERVGVPAFLDRLHQLQFKHLTHPPDYYGLGLILGSGEVSLWELAQAYLILARQGDGIGLKTTISAMETNGERQAHRDRVESVSSPQRLPSKRSAATWALITDMLADPHARARAFGVESLLSLPFPVAVKTGTSSDFRDTWTVGFTRDYTIAVWVGNFDGSPMQKVSGVTGAAPLWHRIMLHLHEQQEPAAFPSPPGLVQRPICALSGARPTPACPSVVQEYFYPEDLDEYDRQPDPFYQVAQDSTQPSRYTLKLPAEYNEWLALHPPSQGSDRSLSNPIQIVSPRNGDLFQLDPGSSTADSTTQQLQFKLAGVPNQPVEWRLNGKLLSTQAAQVFWRLQPGAWRLQVKSGSTTDQVSFQVQYPQPHLTRRGFSLAEDARSHP